MSQWIGNGDPDLESVCGRGDARARERNPASADEEIR